MVTASYDNTARLWDAATGKEVTPLLKHEDTVLHASFSPDGQRVVTASLDHTARLWDADTGKEVTPPLPHEGDVKHASFSPDGKRLVTASRDGTAQLWVAATGQALNRPLKHENIVGMRRSARMAIAWSPLVRTTRRAAVGRGYRPTSQPAPQAYRCGESCVIQPGRPARGHCQPG